MSTRIYIVYTKERETADSYIEKVTHDLANKYQIRVATSDGLEQLIILGHGASRMSAREFYLEYKSYVDNFRKTHSKEMSKTYNMALEDIRKYNPSK